MRIDMPFAIAKVDDDQRLVYGIATADCLDLQGDIIPYEVGKTAVSAGMGTMGIREQHDPTRAVGKLVEWFDDDACRAAGLIAPDEEAKCVGICAYLSITDDGVRTFTKVKEGKIGRASCRERVCLYV